MEINSILGEACKDFNQILSYVYFIKYLEHGKVFYLC
jgi:hypothetical protein